MKLHGGDVVFFDRGDEARAVLGRRARERSRIGRRDERVDEIENSSGASRSHVARADGSTRSTDVRELEWPRVRRAARRDRERWRAPPQSGASSLEAKSACRPRQIRRYGTPRAIDSRIASPRPPSCRESARAIAKRALPRKNDARSPCARRSDRPTRHLHVDPRALRAAS